MIPNDLRIRILELAYEHNHGHIASALSIADVLYILFYEKLNKDDKFILSKGHACLGLYAVLDSKGLKPNMYYGHPTKDVCNGVECTTGSLGHGLPISVGMAFAKKLKHENGNVYVIMSDGECQEGTTWESILFASHHKLDNLFVIIDNNRLQATDFIENVLTLKNIKNQFISFGASVRTIDGHNLRQIRKVLNNKSSKPTVIIANTIKGKGFEMAENKPSWHYKNPPKDIIDKAIRRLNEKTIR